jgi:hypothetical protein
MFMNEVDEEMGVSKRNTRQTRLIIRLINAFLRFIDRATDRFLSAASAAAVAATTAVSTISKNIGVMYRASHSARDFCLRAATSVAAAASGFRLPSRRIILSPAKLRAASAAAAKAAAASLAAAVVITFVLYHAIFTVLSSHSVSFLLENPGGLTQIYLETEFL